jgi:hypothetical protein
MRSRRLAVSLGPCSILGAIERTTGLFHPMRRFPRRLLRPRISSAAIESFTSGNLLPRSYGSLKESAFHCRSAEPCAIPIKFDFVDPTAAGWHGADELCFHWLNEVGRRAGMAARTFKAWNLELAQMVLPPFLRSLNRICHGVVPNPSLAPSPLGDRTG